MWQFKKRPYIIRSLITKEVVEKNLTSSRPKLGISFNFCHEVVKGILTNSSLYPFHLQKLQAHFLRIFSLCVKFIQQYHKKLLKDESQILFTNQVNQMCTTQNSYLSLIILLLLQNDNSGVMLTYGIDDYLIRQTHC